MVYPGRDQRVMRIVRKVKRVCSAGVRKAAENVGSMY